MDNLILDNLKSSIKPGDDIYFLGDLSFNLEAAKEFLSIVKKCNLTFIKGNHDKSQVLQELKSHKVPIYALKTITFKDQPIVLCHYSLRVWDRSHFNAWQLYAHSHGTLPPIGKAYDVGVDNNNFEPVSIVDLFKIMENHPNNFNYIEKAKIKC